MEWGYDYDELVVIKGMEATTMWYPERPTTEEIAEADVIMGANHNSPFKVLKNRNVNGPA